MYPIKKKIESKTRKYFRETRTQKTKECENPKQINIILDGKEIDLKIYSTKFNRPPKCDNLKKLPKGIKKKNLQMEL